MSNCTVEGVRYMSYPAKEKEPCVGCAGNNLIGTSFCFSLPNCTYPEDIIWVRVQGLTVGDKVQRANNKGAVGSVFEVLGIISEPAGIKGLVARNFLQVSGSNGYWPEADFVLYTGEDHGI